MTFARQITTAPVAFDPAFAADVMADLPELPGGWRDLLYGTAGCSPYLAGLMRQEAGWLEEIAEADPDAAFARLLPDGEVTPKELPGSLRAAKRRVALLTALADLGGVWSLEQVTGALTRFADHAVDLAARILVAAEAARGKLPETDADAHGFVALAMGKMGAGELNYSSDIDLICLFDETAFAEDDFAEARAGFIRVTRRLAQALGEVTAEGYVFRTDLRLRPDSGVTPVAMAMEAAERYYESLGRTWERAAHIKARASGGNREAGAKYLERLSPFVWRRHLDFAAIRDVHDMAQKIRDHKGLGGAFDLAGHNVKLGRGGIRQIEFFAQTQQLIFGGRDPRLRVRGTVDALARLAEAGRISQDVGKTLTADYRALRKLEHRIQMVGDQQTHLLPKDQDGLRRIACFLGRSDAEAWARDASALFERVHRLTELSREPAAPKAAVVAQVEDETMARWRTYPAFRSARAVESFQRIRPALMAGFQKAADPARAISSFDSFLSGLPAGVQLFALFESNPHLVELVADISATAPGLAAYLSRNAGVFDAVIAGGFFDDWPGVVALTTALGTAMGAETDYEARLDASRRWAKDWHFRIGVHHLRGLIDAAEAGAQYAELAEAVVAAVLPVVVAEMARKHGPPPGRGAAVLGMGSLGAGRLSAGSDLDLIVIYDANGIDASDGKRPLASRVYYARLTQSLVTALSAPMAEGRLYEVDMRLRPSGRQGPVATALQSFGPYQRTEAWTWEHLALTRARAIAGAPELCAEIETERCAILAEVKDRDGIVADVADMRQRLADEKAPDGLWDAKRGPGRAQDVELLAEMCALRAGAPERCVTEQLALGGLAPGDVETLQTAYEDRMRLQAVAKLTGSSPFDPDAAGAGAVSFLVREFGETDLSGVINRLETNDGAASALIDRILQGAAP